MGTAFKPTDIRDKPRADDVAAFGVVMRPVLPAGAQCGNSGEAGGA